MTWEHLKGEDHHATFMTSLILCKKKELGRGRGREGGNEVGREGRDLLSDSHCIGLKGQDWARSPGFPHGCKWPSTCGISMLFQDSK